MEESWLAIMNKLSHFEIKRGIHSFVNPYSMLLLRKRKDIAAKVDFWYIDGISLVNKVNKVLRTDVVRNSFDNTSIAPSVFKYVKMNNLKMAIIGTKADFIDDAVKNIETNFSINVFYYRNGYFSDIEEREECISYIIQNKIDVVVAGMGTPYQESFLIDLKSSGWDGFGFTCGGYLHQIAKSENYYPVIFDKLNIRWVYRILDEPKLFWRYAIDYPRFYLKFREFCKN